MKMRWNDASFFHARVIIVVVVVVAVAVVVCGCMQCVHNSQCTTSTSDWYSAMKLLIVPVIIGQSAAPIK